MFYTQIIFLILQQFWLWCRIYLGMNVVIE